MGEVKITDLVPQETIDEVKELNTLIGGLVTTYTDTARTLARGLEIRVSVVGDLELLQKLFVEKTREATVATENLRAAVERKDKVLANTTNTISRALMEQERINKTQRAAYTEYDRVKQLLDHYHDTYENQVRSLTELEMKLKANKDAQKENEKSIKANQITMEQYADRQADLISQHRALTQEKRTLTQLMTAEEKAAQSDSTSYVHMSQKLEMLKKAYKELSAEGRDSDFGQELLRTIQELDAHLKDTAADMGEFQRNVGNYAIAGQNGVVSTESLIAAMNQQALTMQDLADQTKLLEEGKRLLDTTDEHYAETLAEVNAQIEENKARLTDVTDILDKEATTAAEAEAQNKRLQEAMKHIDLTTNDAQEKIDALNEKIEQNNSVIERATPTTERLAKEQKELAESAKRAEKEQEELNNELEKQEQTSRSLAEQMLSLIGVNSNFASSLTKIESEGNVIEGLKVKVKAFGKTLTGLLANPWVLAFLGIAGAGALFKWWYEYNKGLERATLLTKNFAKVTGDDMREVRTHVQTLADTMGKGFDETISAANVLANQFGISWNKTMSIMEDGVVLGANLHGNMIANIEKYSGAFKDAGISAEEFMAILVNTKDGLFDEKSLKAITDAGIRIKNMSAKAQKALDDIGISSKKMQDNLKAGNITMVEAIQQVTDRLKELPPNAQEVGSVMVNVFGKKSAMAGQEVIKSISDINNNLDVMKAEMSEVQKINQEQIDTQNKLNATIAAMFDMTGGGFETMTKSAKLYITQGLLKIVQGCVDVANWFIRLYNNSLVVRAGVNQIGAAFKNMWEVAKFVVKQVMSSFKATGKVLEGVFTLDWEKVKEGYSEGLNSLKGNVTALFKGLANNAADAYDATLNGRMKEISVDLNTTGAADKPTRGGDDKTRDLDDTSGDSGKEGGKGNKEAEKRAKEELKRLQELEDSKIAMMADGHEKDLALIRQKFKKKLDEITGNGETENALRVQLAEQCQKEIEECELNYQRELAKINLDNRLASVKKGSEEELTLRLAQLEKSREEELKAAEKTGADVGLIEEKFNRQREDLNEEYASRRAEKIEEEYGVASIERNKAYSDEVNTLKAKYAEEIALAKNNSEKREEIERNLDNAMFELDKKYAQDSAEAAIEMLEKILAVENLSAEEKAKIEMELVKAKMDLETLMADHAIEQAKRITQNDEEESNKRINKTIEWMNVAADAITSIADLRKAFLDRDIENLEQEQEAHAEAANNEQERISDLVAKNVITEEEGEARKRAAEAQTAKKTEELEKKKATLKRKQAIYDKALSAMNVGISTAEALMKLWVSPGWPAAMPMMALVGAMGAIQLATILATPIPKYAKGTDYHHGGPAIVGDGGRPELVLFNGGAWMTPDTPTLVDIPKGASVIPEVPMPLAVDNTPLIGSADYPGNFKPYDDSGIKSAIFTLINIVKMQTKQQHADAYLAKYELYKNRR